MYHPTGVISILIYVFNLNCVSFAENNPTDSVRINKCCELNEILVDLRCTNANEINEGIVRSLIKYWYHDFFGKAKLFIIYLKIKYNQFLGHQTLLAMMVRKMFMFLDFGLL